MGLNRFSNKSIELTSGENKVLEILKKLYSNVEHDVYIYSQQVISTRRPDFVIIDPKRGISILEVKDWSKGYIKSVNKRKVELVDKTCDNPNIQVSGYKSIISGSLFNKGCESITEEEISPVIIFTSLSNKSQEYQELSMLFTSNIRYIFKEDLNKLSIDDLFHKNQFLNAQNELNLIRLALFPELEIVNVKDNEVENTEVKVLDFNQEEFAKRIPYGHYMLTGVPGSGKTAVLLARAIYLVKENPNWKILILTYNKSLSNKLNAQLNKIAEQFKNDLFHQDINLDHIEIIHFHALTSRLTPGSYKPSYMTNDEWFDEEVVQLALNNAYESYDAILIDEYQDFRMSWIELCISLCKSYRLADDNKKIKNIFLAGDRLQSIYNPKDVIWQSIGLNIRGGGRSKFLKTSYRSAKEHMNLALKFLKEDKKLKAEVEKFYTDDSDNEELKSVHSGNLSFISGNYQIIGDEIERLKQLGYENHDFLILCPTKRICKVVRDKAPQSIKYQMEMVSDLNESDIEDNIIITTYHSSKGLEASVVFMVEVDKVYVGESESEQLKRKLIYVGMTRASERLYIYSKVNDNGKYLTELKSLSNR